MLQESDIARVIIDPGLFGLPMHSFAQILADFDIAAFVLPQAATSACRHGPDLLAYPVDDIGEIVMIERVFGAYVVRGGNEGKTSELDIKTLALLRNRKIRSTACDGAASHARPPWAPPPNPTQVMLVRNPISANLPSQANTKNAVSEISTPTPRRTCE
jgi:hypothetical protein